MTAKKYSQGKPKLSIIDPDFMDEMAEVLMMGDKKYGPENWMKGMPFSELIDSAERHISEIKRGIWADGESGKPHTAHVSTCMMILQFYLRWGQAYAGMNDLRFNRRPPSRTGPEIPPIIAHSVWGDDPNHHIDEDYPDEGGPVQLQLQYHIDPKARSGEIDPVKDLQERIKTWADRVMPDRTPQQALSKLVMEEIPELLNGGLDDPLEWADVVILIFDTAYLRGIDIIGAGHDKMSINESSDWTTDPHTGFAKRVK